jgi:nitrate reductase delta subunit
MDNNDLISVWRLLSELLLAPGERDTARLKTLRSALGEEYEGIAYGIDLFMGDPDCQSESEYLQTLELNPPVPLYLGSHLFDEPSTCNGIGAGARNPYMLELTGIYEHFGLDLGGREMPDFLPIMLEFLAISLENSDLDTIGLRRRFIERCFLPGVEAMERAMEKYESPYLVLLPSLQAAAVEDLSRMDDTPAWQPEGEAESSVRLPIIEGAQP